MKRRNRRRKTSNLSFHLLEPRQLLAGDILGAHQVAGQIPVGSNLIVNGDFEDVVLGVDNFYADSDVAGWTAVDSANGQELNIFEYDENTSPDSNYGRVLDIDSQTQHFDRIFQDVDTESGRDYVVAFDFRNHPTAPTVNATEDTYHFQVWWNDALVETYSGTDMWQTGAFSVKGGDLDLTRLLFCELEDGIVNGGDGIGGLLDNVRVVEVSNIAIGNGSFELTSEDQEVFFRPYEVENWGAMGSEVSDRWLKIQESGSGAVATEGTQYLNLDATELTRDMVYSDLPTEAGQTYYLTFDVQTDGDPVASSDELRVQWNLPRSVAGSDSDWAGTIKASQDWLSYGLVVTADADEMRLTFLEPGGTLGDGSGPLIDNVQLFKIAPEAFSIDLNGSEEGVDTNVTFIPNVGAQPISPDIKMEHPGQGRLTSASVELGAAPDGINEIIGIVDSAIPVDSSGNPKILNLGYEPATRQLNLTGSATLAEYEQVLRTLSYYNASEVVTVADREVTISVTDLGLPVGQQTTSAVANVSIETDQALIDDTLLQKYIADSGLVGVEQVGPMYYIINSEGSGLRPTINDNIRTNYTGNLLELNSANKIVKGEVFDSQTSATFPLSQVIRGWQEGLPLIKTGGSITLLIPSQWAYGSGGNSQGNFQNTVLIFDIDLLQIL
ncbi:MAG: FKBP-type peptidyl-prolyl cis-trans isomerase [Mariniblastus sp.]|nr:FKBP-type peptidyl-prolyl cis-trans isomerase [Mariniblastus sp.]